MCETVGAPVGRGELACHKSSLTCHSWFSRPGSWLLYKVSFLGFGFRVGFQFATSVCTFVHHPLASYPGPSHSERKGLVLHVQDKGDNVWSRVSKYIRTWTVLVTCPGVAQKHVVWWCLWLQSHFNPTSNRSLKALLFRWIVCLAVFPYKIA